MRAVLLLCAALLAAATTPDERSQELQPRSDPLSQLLQSAQPTQQAGVRSAPPLPIAPRFGPHSPSPRRAAPRPQSPPVTKQTLHWLDSPPQRTGQCNTAKACAGYDPVMSSPSTCEQLQCCWGANSCHWREPTDAEQLIAERMKRERNGEVPREQARE
jgi:hypothetical protein